MENLTFKELQGLQGEVIDEDEIDLLEKNPFVEAIYNTGISLINNKYQSFCIRIYEDREYDDVEVHVR